MILPRLHKEGFGHCINANTTMKRVTAIKNAGTKGYPGTRNGLSIPGLLHRRTYTAPIKRSAKSDKPTEAYLYKFWKSIAKRMMIAHMLCASIA